MGEFRMPALGADMERGTVVEWLVKPGDYVHRGDIVAVVDTEKADMDIETFEEGVVAELLVGVGATVPVGAALARITATPAAGAGAGPSAGEAVRAAGEAASVRVPAGVPEPAHAAKEPGFVTGPVPGPVPVPVTGHIPGPAPVTVSPPVRRLAHRLGVDVERVRGTGAHGTVTHADVERAASVRDEAAARRVRSSPRARRLAAELGVDLAGVAGTGPQGAVTETDVHRATAPAGPSVPALRAPTPEPEHAPPLRRTPSPRMPEPSPPEPSPPEPRTPARAADRSKSLRHAIGTLMARSKKSIPHYYLSTTLDLGAGLAWMQRANAGRPVAGRLVPAALLFKAAALVAREVSEVNGFFVDGEFRPSAAVHLGVAVALRQGGLVAPAIHDADTLTLDELMSNLRDLVSRARAGHLQRAEMADPTITVTNLGELGVDSVFGVIYPPQVALLGLGRVREEPWARNGLLGVRPAVTATLSADHRVSDGLRGGRFLARIDELLQKPEEL